MPWYDFQCEKCGSVFEVQRSMSDSRKAKCRSCGSTRTAKIFNAAGISFKGNGFYVTDSKGSSKSEAAAPAAPATPSPPKSDSGSTSSGSNETSAA